MGLHPGARAAATPGRSGAHPCMPARPTRPRSARAPRRPLWQAVRAAGVRGLWRPVQAPAVQGLAGRLRGEGAATAGCTGVWLSWPFASAAPPAPVRAVRVPQRGRGLARGRLSPCSLCTRPAHASPARPARRRPPSALRQVAVCTPGRMIDLVKMKACTMKRATYLVGCVRVWSLSTLLAPAPGSRAAGCMHPPASAACALASLTKM